MQKVLRTFICCLMMEEKRKYTLSKKERLSYKRHIDLLFENGKSFIAYPFRIVYFTTDEDMPARVSIMVSVPKKKFKRAVKRNHIKRQAREAYRLNKYGLIDPLEEKHQSMIVAFLYVDTRIHPAEVINKAMRKAIGILKDKE